MKWQTAPLVGLHWVWAAATRCLGNHGKVPEGLWIPDVPSSRTAWVLPMVFPVCRADVNIHFPGRVKRSGFFTRFCVFVGECAKGQVGAKKKQVWENLKKVRGILKYVRPFFRPLQTRMDKAFPKTRSVQQKSPLSLSAFSCPVSPPQNSASAYLFIATMLSCFLHW